MRKTILILLLHFLEFLEFNSNQLNSMLEVGADAEESGRPENGEILEVNALTEELTEVGENRGVINQIRAGRKRPIELLVMCAPLVHVTCLIYPSLYFISLDMPMLLISIVPKESRNVFITSICLIWEILIVSVLLAWGIYVLFTIVSFVLTLTDTVHLVIQRLSAR